MHSNGKPMTKPITEKAITFYDEIKTTESAHTLSALMKNCL